MPPVSPDMLVPSYLLCMRVQSVTCTVCHCRDVVFGVCACFCLCEFLCSCLHVCVCVCVFTGGLRFAEECTYAAIPSGSLCCRVCDLS
eukprot:m.1597677 g.1597677  ORF g.1597677 m.1597677 type:complete len:88 (+) comp25344_c0_seq25:1375-1638(+)